MLDWTELVNDREYMYSLRRKLEGARCQGIYTGASRVPVTISMRGLEVLIKLIDRELGEMNVEDEVDEDQLNLPIDEEEHGQWPDV